MSIMGFLQLFAVVVSRPTRKAGGERLWSNAGLFPVNLFSGQPDMRESVSRGYIGLRRHDGTAVIPPEVVRAWSEIVAASHGWKDMAHGTVLGYVTSDGAVFRRDNLKGALEHVKAPPVAAQPEADADAEEVRLTVAEEAAIKAATEAATAAIMAARKGKKSAK